jgi:anti-sigma factor RsiW
MKSLSCLSITRQLSFYRDGALSGRRARAVDRHLRSCDHCRREDARLERLATLLRATFPEAPEPDWSGFWPGIRTRIVAMPRRTWREALARWVWWPAGRYPRFALGGALAGFLLLASVLGQYGLQERPLFPPGVVISAVETLHPNWSVMVFSSPEDEMTVIWVFGLDQPSDQSQLGRPGVRIGPV